MKVIKLVIIVFAIFFSYHSLAGEFYASKKGAMAGYDPVSYFIAKRGRKGSSKITYNWEGETWRFKTEENKDLFIKSPRKYAPQYGGYCAMAMSENSIVRPKPKYSVVLNEKLYLFFSKEALSTWKVNKKHRVIKGDGHWVSMTSN